MQKRLMGLAIFILGLSLSACTFAPPAVINGSGRVITESRSVSGFNAVELAGTGTLLITQNESESLTIEGEDNIIAEIASEVSDGRLKIGGRRNNTLLRTTKPLTYRLSVKQVQSLSLSGAGSAQADSLTASDFTANLSGVGNLSIKTLNADSLRVTLSGAGSMTIGGTVAHQDVRLSGLGSYHGEALASELVSAQTSGAGSIAVRAAGTLDARVSGVGSIRYFGAPRVTQVVSGLGSVAKAGE